jgi:hypothetical protein
MIVVVILRFTCDFKVIHLLKVVRGHLLVNSQFDCVDFIFLGQVMPDFKVAHALRDLKLAPYKAIIRHSILLQ